MYEHMECKKKFGRADFKLLRMSRLFRADLFKALTQTGPFVCSTSCSGKHLVLPLHSSLPTAYALGCVAYTARSALPSMLAWLGQLLLVEELLAQRLNELNGRLSRNEIIWGKHRQSRRTNEYRSRVFVGGNITRT